MDEKNLKPGDSHYMAYVGPPKQYDFMGATQFRLLCTLGLRADHKVLDFGCGSLRAGRLLMPYLSRGCYFGIDPNKWLIEDALKHQIGQDILSIKEPKFSYNDDLSVSHFCQQFDYIVGQSVFSHSDSEIIATSLRNFEASLSESGLIVVTFIEGQADHQGKGWVYPGCVSYRRETIMGFAHDAGLAAISIPWYHPRQTWYVLAKDKSKLPTSEMSAYLSGAVLFDPEFKESCTVSRKQNL